MGITKIPPAEDTKKPAQAKVTTGRKQRRLIKKKRAGIVLTREEVKAIKQGRKKLRRELRAAGIKSKKEFELTASSLQLYFDKPRFLALIPWLFSGRGLLALLGALALLLLAFFALSLVTQQRGHFTINLSDGMFREGFSLSETVDFENPTMRLFAAPAVDVPAISISDIHEDVNDIDGRHDDTQYFAYTYYIRNEGESTVGFNWQLRLHSESKNISDAVWVMLFEDDVMQFYAKPRADGSQEALPYFDDNSRGYLQQPLLEHAAQPDKQYELIQKDGDRSYYRLIPNGFIDDELITTGVQKEVAPMDVHKYTVVIWLEGDDPDCTNELIGGHAGMDMQFQLTTEDRENTDTSTSRWETFWDSMKFWD